MNIKSIEVVNGVVYFVTDTGYKVTAEQLAPFGSIVPPEIYRDATAADPKLKDVLKVKTGGYAVTMEDLQNDPRLNKTQGQATPDFFTESTKRAKELFPSNPLLQHAYVSSVSQLLGPMYSVDAKAGKELYDAMTEAGTFEELAARISVNDTSETESRLQQEFSSAFDREFLGPLDKDILAAELSSAHSKAADLKLARAVLYASKAAFFEQYHDFYTFNTSGKFDNRLGVNTKVDPFGDQSLLNISSFFRSEQPTLFGGVSSITSSPSSRDAIYKDVIAGANAVADIYQNKAALRSAYHSLLETSLNQASPFLLDANLDIQTRGRLANSLAQVNNSLSLNDDRVADGLVDPFTQANQDLSSVVQQSFAGTKYSSLIRPGDGLASLGSIQQASAWESQAKARIAQLRTDGVIDASFDEERTLNLAISVIGKGQDPSSILNTALQPFIDNQARKDWTESAGFALGLDEEKRARLEAKGITPESILARPDVKNDTGKAQAVLQTELENITGDINYGKQVSGILTQVQLDRLSGGTRLNPLNAKGMDKLKSGEARFDEAMALELARTHDFAGVLFDPGKSPEEAQNTVSQLFRQSNGDIGAFSQVLDTYMRSNANTAGYRTNDQDQAIIQSNVDFNFQPLPSAQPPPSPAQLQSIAMNKTMVAQDWNSRLRGARDSTEYTMVLNEQNLVYQQTLMDLQAKNSQLTGQVQQTAGEANDLANQANKLTGENTDLTTENTDLTGQTTQLQQQLQAKDQEIAQLKQQVADLQRQLAAKSISSDLAAGTPSLTRTAPSDLSTLPVPAAGQPANTDPVRTR